MLDWIRAAHEQTKWTTSVCTGSLVLGAAGVLDGKRATSHWAYRDELRPFGAEPVAERFVVDGKVVTAAGVSAGIDMALHLIALEYGERPRAGDPARDRIRPSAAVRLRVAGEGRPAAGRARPPGRLGRGDREHPGDRERRSRRIDDRGGADPGPGPVGRRHHDRSA